MEIIQQRSREEVVSYLAVFLHLSGREYAFQCDDQGNVDKSKLSPEGLEKFRECSTLYKAGFIEPEIRKLEWIQRTPRIGRCDCGEEIELERFTNTCVCGADYNSAGQLLAPREQWGEETGESVADILSVDHGDENDWDT